MEKEESNNENQTTGEPKKVKRSVVWKKKKKKNEAATITPEAETVYSTPTAMIDAGLKPSEVKGFYDWFGSWQDYNKFYELEAIKMMVRNLELGTKKDLKVLELGCGTGSTAELILQENHGRIEMLHLVDISETMVKLTRKRMQKHSENTKIVVEEANFLHDEWDSQTKYDIIYATFVFDAISNQDIHKAMKIIHSSLKTGGLFGITCLTKGDGFISKGITGWWEICYKVSPKSMGGCRPLIFMKNFVNKELWEEMYHDTSTAAKMITSEISVIKKK